MDCLVQVQLLLNKLRKRGREAKAQANRRHLKVSDDPVCDTCIWFLWGENNGKNVNCVVLNKFLFI